MPTFVWVVDTGDYEDNHIVGIYSSLEKAVESIKTKHDYYPGEGVWGELQKEGESTTLAKRLHQYSQIQYDIIKWEVE